MTFIAKSANTHRHSWTKLTFSRVAFKGLPYALLRGECACGKKQALDFGPQNDMQRLGQLIKQRRTAQTL